MALFGTPATSADLTDLIQQYLQGPACDSMQWGKWVRALQISDLTAAAADLSWLVRQWLPAPVERQNICCMIPMLLFTVRANGPKQTAKTETSALVETNT